MTLSPQTQTPLEIVAAWHSALNTANVDELVALVDENVTIRGPRGMVNGAQVVREWFGRANVQFIPLRWFAQENKVVVEQAGRWLSPETGEITGQQVVATAFVVEQGVITEIMRYDTLDEALNQVELTLADSTTSPIEDIK